MKLFSLSKLYVKKGVLSSRAVCWECDQRRNKFACNTNLHVLDDQVIKPANDDTHVASRAVVESSEVRQEMKKRARETEKRHNRSSLSPSHSSVSKQQWPCHRSTTFEETYIRRQRKRAGNPLPVPRGKDLDIPPEYHQTTSGQQFLLFDSGHGEDRIIIFATERPAPR